MMSPLEIGELAIFSQYCKAASETMTKSKILATSGCISLIQLLRVGNTCVKSTNVTFSLCHAHSEI